ncbi:hypothetical protein Vretimale_9065, partial [Volvox reticuliferus]
LAKHLILSFPHKKTLRYHTSKGYYLKAGDLEAMKVALLLVAAICAVRLAGAQNACPSVSGYSFYRLQGVSGSFLITTVSATNPVDIANACDKTPRCNAFDTTGALRIVPMVPIFSVLDSSASDIGLCDGIYVARRVLTGLILPDGENADTIRQKGAKTLVAMNSFSTAVSRVAAKLIAKGNKPKDAGKLSKDVMIQAFKDAQVPLATPNYTYSQIVAALSYPEWDSRAANGTTYNYVSPVKDQANCGSCVAFALTAAAETAVAAVKAAIANTNDFSEQWLFFCNAMYTPTCNTGWYGSQAANVLANKNIPYDMNYPYIAAPGCTLASSPEIRAGGKFSYSYYYDINLAKQHIRTYGAVTTYFTVYNDFFYWLVGSKPYVWDGASPLAGYHQVVVIGYNDTGSYWIAKNSWGTSWGDRGYFRISYSANVGFMSLSGDNVIGIGWVPPISPPSPPPPPPPFVCGDGLCNGNKTCTSCSADCGRCSVCGDNACTGTETCSTCLMDCGIPSSTGILTCCGDGLCDAAASETCQTCPSDCGVCPTCNKNGICETDIGEKCVTGTSGCSDCGTCGTSSYCGDGKCTSSRKGYTETCGSCALDCGKCSDATYCGDGTCNGGETTSSCSRDCNKAKMRVFPGVSEDATPSKNPNAAAKPPPRKALLRA